MRITLLDCDPEIVFGDSAACSPRLRGLARAFARTGHDVTLLCAAPTAELGATDESPRRRTLRVPVSEREIDWHFSHVSPELVIERLVPDALAGARVSAEAGVLHLFDVEADAVRDAYAGSNAVRSAVEPALALGTAALASSGAVAARVRALQEDAMPLEVVPDAADDACFADPAPEQVARLAQRFHLPARVPCIVFAGDLEHGCGLLALIAALARFPGEPRPRVVVLGDGPERNTALRAAAAAHVGLVLCGDVPAEEWPALLALGTLVCTPGDDYGAPPRALLGALAAGRPVLLPDTAAVREHVRHDHDAWLVRADAPEAYAAGLADLLGDPTRRARIGARARASARRAHTWDARAAQVLAFARTLTARGAPDRHARGAEAALRHARGVGA